MVARDTAAALARLKAVVRQNPQIEQDLTQWSDLALKETATGEWQATVTNLQGEDNSMTFTSKQLTVTDIFTVQKAFKEGNEADDFIPIITIDSPKGTEPGAISDMTVEEVRQKVEADVARLGLPGEPTEPKGLTLIITPNIQINVKDVRRLGRRILRRLGL